MPAGMLNMHFIQRVMRKGAFLVIRCLFLHKAKLLAQEL